MPHPLSLNYAVAFIRTADPARLSSSLTVWHIKADSQHKPKVEKAFSFFALSTFNIFVFASRFMQTRAG